MTIELKVPSAGESITEVTIVEWTKEEGAAVRRDEIVAVIETDKANVEVVAPAEGRLVRIVHPVGEVVKVGAVIGLLDAAGQGQVGTQVPAPAPVPVPASVSAPSASAPSASAEVLLGAGSNAESNAEPVARSAAAPVTPPSWPKQAASEMEAASEMAEAGRIAPLEGQHDAPSEPRPESNPPSRSWASPAIRRALRQADLTPAEVTPSGPAGRITMQDVAKVDGKGTGASAPPVSSPGPASAVPSAQSIAASSVSPASTRREDVVPMTLLRRRIAERLVSAQQSAALLTTFNEVDMSNLLGLRARVQEKFTQKHGIKLGFMSFFVKAVVEALKDVPALNAEIRGDQIIYRHYFDVGVAVGGGRGLVVPILRNAESLGFADIERQIADYARRAKENKLKVEDLQGGTFTISNGGVYGSLLSTPIVNPPQSGILGMHAIQDRPVVRDGQVVAAKMMYIALTYDHRIVDGREAVTFLVRVKDFIEDPTRLLFDL
ncbi:MAG: 2-oxoglutarate dehydrogenase complex dihydrolipoyllysine-residue succinyltransferase [Deltaproteobacteria bacterium]|nr:2-oxoglutarate dehydrogenase complex dihydrolipoyllysine-residue succinyltransferase [Deltaproteobacteria bacterium]